MKYFYKAYLWKNGQKAEDLSQHLAAPLFLEERLNEELDTGEIILESMPDRFRKSFPPKTKIRIERYTTSDYSGEPVTWDMLVDHDDIEDYEGVPGISCHRLHLIEPSVIAQGMHVDNIALTYELQDVTLSYQTVVTESGSIKDKNGYYDKVDIVDKKSEHLCQTMLQGWSERPQGSDIGYAYFRNSYRYIWTNTESIEKIQWRYDFRIPHEIKFTVPTLMFQGVMSAASPNFSDIYEMYTEAKVIKRLYAPGTGWNEEVIDQRICGPTLSDYLASGRGKVENEVYYIHKSQGMGNPGDPVIDRYSIHATKIGFFNSTGTSGLSSSVLNLDNFEDHFSFIKPNRLGASSDLDMVRLHDEDEGVSSKQITITTATLTEQQIAQGYRLEYALSVSACNDSKFSPNASINNLGKLLTFYEAKCKIEKDGLDYKNIFREGDETFKTAEYSDCHVTAKFIISNTAVTNDEGPFLKKGSKYSAYKLIRKALLTCETQIFDNGENGYGLDDDFDENGEEIGIPYSIYVDPDWIKALKDTTIFETIFEGKNLWEILLQAGYYLHAIPFLQFAKDGTDRFMLTFRELGKSGADTDTTTKITVYNSQTVNEYFAQLDVYVSNFFSPQNVVEEWVVPKSTNGSFLVSNDSAEIPLKYSVSEILYFGVKDCTEGAEREEVKILDYIFEESICSILTSYYKNESGDRVLPSKGAALYYSLGENVIKGLSYVPPSVSDGEMQMSLKNILQLAYGLSESETKNFKFNNLKFHIKYRTQDSARISQFRPDFQTFVQNSTLERFPHHEQYYGQQEKIVDSERLSGNLFGQLIRTGNRIYQRQECATPGREKESGDLIEIRGERYYVTVCENEYYPDVILQKVTYSKNFNDLSKIVTIPSEPRFYEVGERSKVRRETRHFEFLALKNLSDVSETCEDPLYLESSQWKAFIRYLIFKEGDEKKVPNYAFVSFLADRHRYNSEEWETLFPSSEVICDADNNLSPKKSSDHASCIVPLLNFPMKDGILFECDLDDNFKAGDFIDKSVQGGSGDSAYFGMQALRYCDVYGRADLCRFKFFFKNDWTMEQSQLLPKAVDEDKNDWEPTDSESIVHTPSGKVVGLDKDCREEISIDFQISLLYDFESVGKNFVTYPNLFGEKEGRLKCCLLKKEVSMFDSVAGLTMENIVADNIGYTLVDDESLNLVKVLFHPVNMDLTEVKSVVFYDEFKDGSRASCFAKNVAGVAPEDKLNPIAICPTLC